MSNDRYPLRNRINLNNTASQGPQYIPRRPRTRQQARLQPSFEEGNEVNESNDDRIHTSIGSTVPNDYVNDYVNDDIRNRINNLYMTQPENIIPNEENNNLEEKQREEKINQVDENNNVNLEENEEKNIKEELSTILTTNIDSNIKLYIPSVYYIIDLWESNS